MKLLGLLSTGIVGGEMSREGLLFQRPKEVHYRYHVTLKVPVTFQCQFFVQVSSAGCSDNDLILLVTAYSRKVCIPFWARLYVN